MKQTSLIVTIACVIAIIFSGCGDKRFKGYEKTKNGLYYKFEERNPEGKLPKTGDFLYLTISYRSDNDSISEYHAENEIAVLDSSFLPKDVYESFSMMKEGEKAEFVIKADSFFIITYGLQTLPNYITDKDILYFNVRLNNVKTMEEVIQNEQDAIENYLQENGLEDLEPTNIGMYFIEKGKGSGKKIEMGQNVTVHFTGKYLDGTVFQSTLEENRPFPFPVGQVPCFSEAVLMMNEGGKANILLPYSISYYLGHPMISPFTPVIFEIEVLEVK